MESLALTKPLTSTPVPPSTAAVCSPGALFLPRPCKYSAKNAPFRGSFEGVTVISRECGLGRAPEGPGGCRFLFTASVAPPHNFPHQDAALRRRGCGVNLLVPRKPLQSPPLLSTSSHPIHPTSRLPHCRPSSVTSSTMSVEFTREGFHRLLP